MAIVADYRIDWSCKKYLDYKNHLEYKMHRLIRCGFTIVHHQNLRQLSVSNYKTRSYKSVHTVSSTV